MRVKILLSGEEREEMKRDSGAAGLERTASSGSSKKRGKQSGNPIKAQPGPVSVMNECCLAVRFGG